MKKRYILFLFAFVIFLCTGVFAQFLNPGSSGAAGGAKNVFSTEESVYIKGSAVCTINKAVNVFIVEDKSAWVGGESLVDVRGAAQKITTDGSAALPLTVIWSNPKAGDYDIIVDCNNNGKFDVDPILEPVDSIADVGFTVEASAGSGEVNLGDNDPGDHSWSYDAEIANLKNVMMQLNVEVSGEGISLVNITVEDSSEGSGVDKLEIYADENSNGAIDAGEEMLGSANFKDLITVKPNYLVSVNGSVDLLLVYVMKSTAEGNFSFKVMSVYGVGEDSDDSILFTGTPVSSGVKNVGEAVTCKGLLTLSFNPADANEGDSVEATFGNLSGCEDISLELKSASCGSVFADVLCDCVVDGDGCSCDFTAGSASKTYYGCVDKNVDTDFSDYGESVFTELTIGEAQEEVVEVQEEEVVEEVVEEQEEETEDDGIGFFANSSLLFLLFIAIEITLILIFIILLLILLAMGKDKVKE